MTERDFNNLLKSQWKQKRFLCVGLDPDYEKIPEAARKNGVRETIVAFNRAIIDATKDLVCSYKPNSAFYETHGDEGWNALRETIEYIHEVSPDVPVILDAKRADIGNTNRGYVESAFDHLKADAITVHPYMGGESLKEFFERKEKGIFVMCRNSNPGAGEFQDLEVDGEPLYIHLAKAFAEKWNKNRNCGLVVGATYPEEIANVRNAAPDVTLLIPGIGAQGGDLEKSVAAAKDSHRQGFIIAVGRSIMYVSAGADYAEAARAKAQEYDGMIRKAL